jgi:beta-lactamase regulating signal transducer with metallopeptidase domain/protocatechuate 3,4-dioxygenase beta subunit
MSHILATWPTALAGSVLTWLVQSSALLALGLVAGHVLKRTGPAVQSATYRTALVAVLVCPFASSLLSAAGYDGLTLRLPAPRSSHPPAAPPSIVSEEPITAGTSATGGREDLNRESSERLLDAGAAARGRPMLSGAALTSPRPLTVFWTKETAAAIGLFAWVLGAALLGARLVVGHLRMIRLRAMAVPVEPGAEAICRELAAQIGVGAPVVLRSPFLFSPCLDGMWKPAILLPDDLGQNLRETFVHELAHLARRDGCWNVLRRLSVAAFWAQPLLWVLSRRLEAAAEEVCDDFVLQFGADRARYAGHLLELAGRTLPPVAPAGVGMVSLRSMLARRIVRLLDTSQTISTRAGARAIVAMLGIGLVGTLLTGLLAVRSGKAETRPQAAAGGPQSRDQSIRGQVVGPDGQPVAGAKVTAWRKHLSAVPEGHGYKTNVAGMWQYEYVRKTADAQGRFEVSFGPIDPSSTAEGRAEGVSIIATAPGFGLGYYLKDRPIRLSDGDQPVNGRLVDLEGQPVAGATVRIVHVWVPDTKARREAASRSGPYEFPFAQSLALDGEPVLPDGVVTDAVGRFRIDGLGRDVMALLELVGPNVAFKRFRVVSHNGPIAVEPRNSGSGGVVMSTTHGAECTVAVEPARPIEGVVRDIETKQPIAGASVTAHRLSGSRFGIDGLIRTQSDAQGRYRLVGLPKEGSTGHQLAVHPPIDQPYFMTDDIDVPPSPGLDAVHLDISLRRATWVTGKVTDLKTRRPVANALIDYFPMIANERAKDYPNFNPAISGSVAVSTRYRTDRDGRFRVAALHGRGVVTVRVEFGPYRTGFGAEAIRGRSEGNQLLTYDHIYTSMYHGLKEVDVPDGSDSYPCEIPLDPGGTLDIRLVDTSGAPVTTAVVSGRLPDSIDLSSDMRGASIAHIAGLEPGKPRTLVAQEPVRKIGAVLTVPPRGAKDGDAIDLVLRPNATITGRFVDEAGQPAAGYVQVRHVPGVAQFHDEMHIADVKVDPDGGFRCDDLPAGGSYRVWLINREGSMARVRQKSDPFQPFELAERMTVEPGQVVNLGTYNVVTGKRIQAPAATEKADIPIRGRIVDLEGRPVAGVTVTTGNFLVPKSGDLSNWVEAVKKGEPPWIAGKHIDWNQEGPATAQHEATTDADGRCRLEGLGAERVVSLTLKGDSIAATTIHVATREMAAFPARGFQNQHGPGVDSIYGAEFTYTATLSRPIEGVLTDATTGKPLVGTDVRSYHFAGSDFVGIMTVRTKTDAQGRFRLTGMPKGKGNKLIIVPADDQPYLVQELDIPDPAGAGPVSGKAALSRGVWIEGTLTEKATGKPVPGAWLHYIPFLNNAFAQVHSSFHQGGPADNADIQDRYQTKADGSFRLVGLPGRAIVGAVVHGKAYLQGVGSESIAGMNKHGHFETFQCPIPPGKLWPTVMKEIDPAADATSVRIDLQVTHGFSLQLKVVDGEGKRVTGASTRGLEGRSSYEREPLAGSEANVSNLQADEERIVVVVLSARKIGKAIKVRKGDDAGGPAVARLEPLAALAGRVVDASGNPVEGATIRPDLLPHGDFGTSLAQVTTDQSGRFLVPEVPTGCDYALAAESPGMNRDRRFAFLKKATVKPGETTDVGDIRFKND